MKKRILSILLAVAMVIGWIPAMALGVGATETTQAKLVLKPVDSEGNLIDTDSLGALDVLLNNGAWVDSLDDGENDIYPVNVGENTLSGWDFCPDGYEKPDYDITFDVDANGNLTITSDNATLEVVDDTNYIVVSLTEGSSGEDGECTEHTYEDDRYFQDGDYHYQWCDICDYYDLSSAEPHYEEGEYVDHYCDACGIYVRGFCTPGDAETDHYCAEEMCAQRLTDLCTDEDLNHVCDGCDMEMDWMCADNDGDHRCDTETCGTRLSDCQDYDENGVCDTCEALLASVSAEYTELNYTYDSELEEILVSGSMKIVSNASGTLRVEWMGYDAATKSLEVIGGEETTVSFLDVPFFYISDCTITLTPDDESFSAVEQYVCIDGSATMLRVEASGPFDEAINGTPMLDTVINDVNSFYLYLLPGTEVTVKLNLQPGDSYTVEQFIFEGANGEELIPVEDDGAGTLTFTLPETHVDRLYLNIYCEHDATACADADSNHFCDSDLCRKRSDTADEDGNNLCDVCGRGMLQIGNAKGCDTDAMMDTLTDGDTIKLLADHHVEGGTGWNTPHWFTSEEPLNLVLDLNGFTLSVGQANYLISLSENITLKIIDSSEAKTGALENPNGNAIIEIDGGALDLRDYPSPEGITVYNYGSVVGVTGHMGEEPIMVLLPEDYAVNHKDYGVTTTIPGKNSVAVVLKTRFVGASLALGTDLTMNYYVTIPDGADAADYSVRFTVNGKVTSVSLLDAVQNEKGEYVVGYTGIAPQQMADNIKAELLCGEWVIAAKDEYSVKANAEELLREYSEDTELVQLLTDLLTYGASAQNYKDYNTENLANADVAGMGTPSEALPADTDKSLTTHVESSVKFTAATLWFDNVNKIGVKLSATEGVTLKVNGETVELTGTTYYTEAIYATGFGEIYTFELYEGETPVQTLTYSVNSYVHSMANGGTENAEMAELAKALYNYGVSAEAYSATLN